MTETQEATLGQGEALPESSQAPVEQAPTDAAIQQPETDAGKPRDEGGRFKPRSTKDIVREAAEKLKASQAPTETPVIQTEDIAAPEHWPAEFKDGFSKLKDAESRKLYMEAVKNVEAAHTKRSQEFAPYKELDKFWEPYKANGTPIQALQYYMGIEQQLNTNPVQALTRLAQMYNVNLGQLQQPQQQESEDFEFVDPVVKQLQQRLDNYEQTQRAQQVAQYQEQINSFKAEKDASGNLKYPHYDRLEPEMERLFKAGLGKSLPELYEKALYLDSNLRAEVEAEKLNKAIAEKEAARKAELEKAKAASTHLNGAAPAKHSIKATTGREAVQAALRQMRSN